MPGLYGMAVVTTVVLVAAGIAIYRREDATLRRVALLAVLLELPMSAGMFYAVRLPIIHALQAWLGKDAAILPWILSLAAPLTEEPAKLWPMLLPWFRRQVTPATALKIGVALGLGFGLGEVWFLAYLLHDSPAVAPLAWYMFTGFLWERTTVTFVHGTYTSRTLLRWFDRPWRGFGLSVLLHFLGNFPIFVMAKLPLLLSLTEQFWICGMLVVLLTDWHGGSEAARKAVLGESTCPECGTRYVRPWIVMNLGPRTSFEPCPHCRHWHLIRS